MSAAIEVDSTHIDSELHESEAASDRALLSVLRDLRRSLLQHDAIRDAVQALRKPVSAWDFWFSVAALFGGGVFQAFAVSHLPWLLPLGLVVQLIGLAGLQSLAHESWHRRAHPNRRFERWVARWLIHPTILSSHEALSRDHVIHHRRPGEPSDPSSTVWAQTGSEFGRSLVHRLTILPAVWGIARGLFTGQRGSHNWQGDDHKASTGVWVGIGFLHGLWAGTLFSVSPWALLVAYVLPLVLGSVLVNIREYREHARLPDGRTAVFDLLCNDFERLLIPGGYFNLHALHHIFPEVPQRQLPRLYRVIDRTIDMRSEYYGVTPQVGRRDSYLRVPAPL